MEKTRYRRLESIDFLRGIAAMSVVLFHLTHAKGLLDSNGIVHNIFKQGGGFGVSVFFVAVCIFLIKESPRMFLFFGKISFSLYLIHVPLGGFMKLFITVRVDDFTRTALTMASIIPIVFISYGFYKLMEEPCMLLSKK